jgi:taurine transport system substrate-binding protein
MRFPLRSALIGLAALLPLASAQAADSKKVVVAYQTGAAPYIAGIASGQLAKDSGWDIEFRRFNSGAEIFAAIASGDVQIGDVGSSPFAASVSRGIGVKAVYISAGSGEDEAFVVRHDVKSLDDLKGRKFAAAPVSTDHYQLLAALKQQGLTEQDAQVIAIPQPEIVAAWKRGDIDGAFVWDPALAELKKDGHILLTAKQVAERGAPTFGAVVVTTEFADANPEFVTKYVGLIHQYYVSYQTEKAAWGPDSENARLLAGLQGGTPEENVARLAQAALIPLEDQISDKWLGGGDNGGVAKTLKDTSAFLKDQKKITAVKDAYGAFADPQYLAAAQTIN